MGASSAVLDWFESQLCGLFYPLFNDFKTYIFMVKIFSFFYHFFFTSLGRKWAPIFFFLVE